MAWKVLPNPYGVARRQVGTGKHKGLFTEFHHYPSGIYYVLCRGDGTEVVGADIIIGYADTFAKASTGDVISYKQFVKTRA